MSFRKTTITVLAALFAWTAAPSATAQLMEPATGWVPGQPYVVTVSDSALEPLMVVYVGRIPLLSTGKRVRLLLPNLDRTGLVYTVSTYGDDAGRRPPGSGPRKAREPQYVVGRVHTVVIQSPANPALGQAPDILLVIDARGITTHMSGSGGGGGGQDDQTSLTLGTMVTQGGVLDTQPWMGRRSLDGGRPEHHGVPPQPDPHGAQRRMVRPPEPTPMRRLADGMGTLDVVRNALDGSGDRADTYDTGGAGVMEATVGDDPCFKGPYVTQGCASVVTQSGLLGVQPASTRRTFDGGRPAGERVIPRKRGGVPRPLEDVPFVRKRGFPDAGGGVLGTGRVPWNLGDQGHTLEGSMR